MGRLFYMMGKSAAGKDTICEQLLSRKELGLFPFITFTTRPIRRKEQDGQQYYFVTEEKLHQMQEEGKVIEQRSYHTVQGIWYYFTADTEAADMEHYSYLALGTLASYEKIRDYYGAKRVVPLYIESRDDLRLERALKRERKQAHPDYAELCRRFLSDQEDFSEENIARAGIERRFLNNTDRQACTDEVADFIQSVLY